MGTHPVFFILNRETKSASAISMWIEKPMLVMEKHFLVLSNSLQTGFKTDSILCFRHILSNIIDENKSCVKIDADNFCIKFIIVANSAICCRDKNRFFGILLLFWTGMG